MLLTKHIQSDSYILCYYCLKQLGQSSLNKLMLLNSNMLHNQKLYIFSMWSFLKHTQFCKNTFPHYPKRKDMSMIYNIYHLIGNFNNQDLNIFDMNFKLDRSHQGNDKISLTNQLQKVQNMLDIKTLNLVQCKFYNF